MLLCVPIVGRDGAVYGVCGFEISQIYFKLRLAQSGAVPHMTGLLAPCDGGVFDTDAGFECGDRNGHYKEITGSMTSSQERSFLNYSSADGSFVGVEASVRLSPLENERRVAVMIPKEDYDSLQSANTRENLVICLLLLLTAAFGSVFMSRSYLRPVLRGLEQIKQGGAKDFTRTNIPEIDDLMDFLEEEDKTRETERKKLEEQLVKLGAQAEKEKIALPNREDYDAFRRNLETLTPGERRVFDLYREGYRAKDMPDIIGCTTNAIKYHNRNIYQKLWVSSRDELLGYIKMMDDEEKEVKADASGSVG
jgi:DNA-binding CsgD family transcriptional regulator